MSKVFGNLSANQINAGMGLGPGGVGDQSQALFNNLYGPQGFGGQTAAYAGAGAASTAAIPVASVAMAA